MTPKTLIGITLVSATLAMGSTAFAAGSHQTHHCKQADGSMDMTKTKKACLAAKGSWVKDAAAPAASAASK
jgi:hypothetical protein